MKIHLISMRATRTLALLGALLASPGAVHSEGLDAAGANAIGDVLATALDIADALSAKPLPEHLKASCVDASHAIDQTLGDVGVKYPVETIGSGAMNAFRDLGQGLVQVCGSGATPLEQMGLKYLVRQALISRTISGSNFAAFLDASGTSGWESTLDRL